MIEEMINQPTLVRLRVPIKVYGDLHGRYGGNKNFYSLIYNLKMVTKNKVFINYKYFVLITTLL